MTPSGSARPLLAALAWAFVPLPAAQAAAPADYPQRPIRIVIPFQTGGLPDIAARLIGPKLTEAWKQPVVVENRPGAGGVLGSDIVARATPDGHTLLMASSAHAAMPVTRARLPFDPLKSFAPITITASGAYALIVPASLGVGSVKELIALARSKPGALNFASAGTGSGTHFAAELFRDLARIDAVHVPYKGIPDALTDTIAGRVQFFMPPLASALPHARENRVRVLAVSQRVSQNPDIPSFESLGMKGYDWNAWSGLLAPAKTPSAVIDRIHAEVARAMKRADVREKMAAVGADTEPTTPAAFTRLIASQIELTTSLAKRAGIRPQ